jgi:hypothetical protein
MRFDEFALGVLEPLPQSQFLSRHVSTAEEERIASSDIGEEDNNDDSSAPASGALTRPRAQQAQVAQMIGDTMMRLDRLAEALSYFEVARHFENSPAGRKELKRKIADAKATLRVQHQNAQRQPLLHEALEQDRVVRPRLLAGASPAPRAATVKGGLKP